MKISIFGGTGFIGKKLVAELKNKGHRVFVLDQRKNPNWKTELEGSDAVVNLAGEPIFGRRWNRDIKAAIWNSREEGTRLLVEALGELKTKSGQEITLINASAIGFYGPHWDEILDENSGPGSDFLAQVCRAWEDSAKIAELRHGIRTVLLRIGIVLGPKGGALSKMLLPFKLGLGGTIESGAQYMSWIHVDDVVGLIVWAIENPQIRGVLNATAPTPITNKEYTKTLGSLLRRPTFLPVPGIGLFALFGEAAEVLVNGQRVLPKVALNQGYKFKYPTLAPALQDALKN